MSNIISTQTTVGNTPVSPSPSPHRTKKKFENSRGPQGKNTGRSAGLHKRPQAKPSVKREPVNLYLSTCCSVRATKPPAGQAVTKVDPEGTKKPKKETKGLGSWRCPQCKKSCSVTQSKPQPAVQVVSEVTSNASV